MKIGFLAMSGIRSQGVGLATVGLITMFCSGCASMVLLEAGKQHRELHPKSVVVAENGAVFAVVELATTTTFVGKDKPCIRYVVAEPEVAQTSVTQAVDSGSRGGRRRCVINAQIVSPKEKGWHLLPYDTRDQDADPSLIPSRFKEGNWVLYGGEQGFPFVVEKNADTLYQLVLVLPKEFQSGTVWWHYPTLVLLPPAFAFDVATFPVQLAIGMHMLSKMEF
jgi:hypothetical protein